MIWTYLNLSSTGISNAYVTNNFAAVSVKWKLVCEKLIGALHWHSLYFSLGINKNLQIGIFGLINLLLRTKVYRGNLHAWVEQCFFILLIMCWTCHCFYLLYITIAMVNKQWVYSLQNAKCNLKQEHS